MTRKLVTVREVSEVSPIPGADAIEVATVDGWKCVVKKGEFEVGDLGLYFEIDSFVPKADTRFAFMEKSFTVWNGFEGARIRTIRLRGQISQGLLLPLSSFPEIGVLPALDKDFSEVLKVIKWDPESILENSKVPAKGMRKVWNSIYYRYLRDKHLWLQKTLPWIFSGSNGNGGKSFPSFIPKTDEDRVQNCLHRLGTEDPETMYEVTVKLDGSSMTCYYNQRKFGVCSRNINLKKSNSDKFWRMAEEMGIEKALKKLGRNLAIQGELIGPGIQGNPEGSGGSRFYVFNVYDIDTKKYLGAADRGAVLSLLHDYDAWVPQVPGLGVKRVGDFKTIDDFLAFSEGPSLFAKTREGVVFKKLDGSSSFKVISNSYLLKTGN